MNKIILNMITAALIAAMMSACGGSGSKSCIAITFCADYIGFYMAGSGAVTIDWGDGSPVETRELRELQSYEDYDDMEEDIYRHEFSEAVARTVTVTGDNITYFSSSPLRDNILTALDVSRNPALETLYCAGNQLPALDVSRNTALKDLSCGGNRLTELDLSRNTALENLFCNDNRLTALDLSRNTELKSLWCGFNQLTALDLSRNVALTKLDCDKNEIAALDVSRNTALKDLSCYHNRLTALDLSRNASLERLTCSSNQLTALDLSRNTALEWLDCSNNRLTALDVSRNTVLKNLWCYNNQITALDVSSNTALEILSSDGNPFAVGSKNGITLTAENGNIVFAMSGSGAITIDWGDGSQPETHELQGFPENGVMYMDVYEHDYADGNPVTITVTGGGITHFVCFGFEYPCGLTGLDVSQNPALTYLNCFNGKLTRLDVSRNTALTYLECTKNRLTRLDVSLNTALTYLGCADNKLTGLDVSACRKLEILYSDFPNMRGTCGDNLKWTLLDGALTITGSGAMQDYEYDEDGDSYPMWYRYGGNRDDIRTVSLPGGLTSVGRLAFTGLGGLTAVAIPATVTSIGESAFSHCSSLKTVNIPASVTEIQDWAFSRCSSVTAFTADDRNTEYSSEDGVLFNRSKTVLILYPAGKTGDYAIPPAVKSIATGAFDFCKELTSVTFPASVTSVKDGAFNYCSKLSAIYDLSNTPPTIDDGAFFEVDKSKCTLYVPAASVEAYRKAEVWKEFKNIKSIE